MSVKYKFLNNETGILFLIRLRIPIFLLTLLHKREIWLSQVNFSLIITPRNLVCRTLSNGLWSMLTLKSAVIGLVVNSIKLHILTLTEILFRLNQLFISESVLFAQTDSLYISVSYRNTLVSSANNSNLALLLTLTISLIYKMNSKGPRTDPCGTPVRIGKVVER